MKNIVKKLLGIDKLEAAKALAEEERAKAEQEAKLAKLTPKERATELKEPYVAVLDTHVNKDNVRNGFFELDWNEYFIVQLRQAGYSGDSEEAVVDAWFKDLCRDVAKEEDISMDRRGSGFINVNNLGNGKSEVS